MQQPLAEMRRRVTDWASATKTNAAAPRTFTDVLSWEGFQSDALARLHDLDDTKHAYKPQVAHGFVLSALTLLILLTRVCLLQQDVESCLA